MLLKDDRAMCTTHVRQCDVRHSCGAMNGGHPADLRRRARRGFDRGSLPTSVHLLTKNISEPTLSHTHKFS